MKILLTGATGLIGKQLGKVLVEKGHELIVVSRNEAEARTGLPFPCRVIEADLVAAPLKDEVLLHSIDVVVHLMGESLANGRWDEAKKRRIYESRIIGTRHLVESFITKPKVFISASAVGYYGSCGHEEIDESHGAGDDFLGQLCQDWEEELLPLTFGGKSARVVSLRTGMVLASQGGALDKMIPLFNAGLGGVLGTGLQWMSWIHIDDAVGLIVHAIEKPSISGALNVVSPAPVTNAQFTNELAAALKTRVGPRIPQLAITVALGEMSIVALSSQRAMPSKALHSGYRFKFLNLAEALKDVCSVYPEGEAYFQSEQYLSQSPEQIFPFFSEAKNLQKITPPFLNFKILEQPSGSLFQGAEIRYSIKIHGVPMEWITVIEDWNPPFKFIDTQKKGPYKFWHHTHEFIPFAGGTLVVDRVRYRLPLGIFGGVVAGNLVKKDIQGIFNFRRKYFFENFEKELQSAK
ncbi:MAG: TIGR01777 family protein [Bdellovibrionaceae bacterium]|nr:TIGR01777 family protein [Pseudobdellovibrionaceae bacterium]